MSSDLQPRTGIVSGLTSLLYNQLFGTAPPPPPGTDLTGHVYIVTGANVGLGLACARHLLALGSARIVMGVRSLERGEAAAGSLRAAFPAAAVDVWELDMVSYKSVQRFAARCADVKQMPRLDGAVLNAGLIRGVHEFCEETGHEVVAQVNYWSTALLALLLLPTLKDRRPASPGGEGTTRLPATLVIVSSAIAMWQKALVGLPDGRTLAEALDATPGLTEAGRNYEQTKFLEIVFAAELAARVDPRDVLITSVNPGLVSSTGFASDFRIVRAIASLAWPLSRTPADGAMCYVYGTLGLLGPKSHGSYLSECKITP